MDIAEGSLNKASSVDEKKCVRPWNGRRLHTASAPVPGMGIKLKAWRNVWKNR